ncbi:MAG TPA: prepilin-type N-terminal cleavage/methylation domain-containing protein [Solirubrobacteraceae bacterium]
MPNSRQIRRRDPIALSEAGFTMIEVLVVCLLMAVVLGALLAPVVISENRQLQDSRYSYSQQLARTGLEAMVSQIEQASAILSTTPNSVDMNVTWDGSALQVYFACDIRQPGTAYNECVRVQSAQGTALPPLSSGTTVIKNLLNGTGTSPVFSFAPDPIAPYYMTATVEVPASGGASSGLTNSIRFDDGALMRNLNIGN